MPSPTDPLASFVPPLRVGERVSLRVVDADGLREVMGFVTALSQVALRVVDRRGTEHDLDRPTVDAARRVAVARGRAPAATPRDLLDALAERAAASGTPWVARISDVLQGRTPPASVPAWGEWAVLDAVGDGDGVRARFEGEWVTLASASLDAVVAACWWATRMGARSVQVRLGPTHDPAPLRAAGFTALES